MQQAQHEAVDQRDLRIKKLEAKVERLVKFLLYVKEEVVSGNLKHIEKINELLKGE